MPEILEIEMYRRAVEATVGRQISTVDAPDAWFLKHTDAAEVRGVLEGSVVERVGRVGKLMLLETTRAMVGLRFGMTGIPIVDDQPVLEELEYSSRRLDPSWNRVSFHFDGGGSLAINDPRRLGGVELEPDLNQLGPDAWSLTGDQLHAIFGRYRVATKALLLNQKRIAGLGNLLADELLWRSAVAPHRPANEVSGAAVDRIGQHLGPMLNELYERGGSNCGDHFDERNADGRCPRDGAAMAHATVGGRSTWWCPEHQV